MQIKHQPIQDSLLMSYPLHSIPESQGVLKRSLCKFASGLNLPLYAHHQSKQELGDFFSKQELQDALSKEEFGISLCLKELCHTELRNKALCHSVYVFKFMRTTSVFSYLIDCAFKYLSTFALLLSPRVALSSTLLRIVAHHISYNFINRSTQKFRATCTAQ